MAWLCEGGSVTPVTHLAPARNRDFRDWQSVLGRFVFFTWWIRWQARFEAATPITRRLALGIAVLFGVGARLWAQSLPGNWDFGQWINVSGAVLTGQDPYELFGYNYPPPWLSVLTLFNAVSASDATFRLMISVFLIAADLGIAWLLVKRGFALAAILFLISPIAIAITGQHQQVEGVAVFLALAAMAVLAGKDSASRRISGSDWWTVLLLGLSLSFKPVFLLLPLWLAFRSDTVQRRIFLMLGPLAVFGFVFASAFLFYPPATIIEKVLQHSGANNSPFLTAFSPSQITPWLLENGGGKVAFVVILIASGWFFRRLPAFQLALAYSLTAVVFSWAVVNQYLAGPMAAVAIFMNAGLLVWFVLASVYLGGDSGVLNLPIINQIQPHVLLEWQVVMQDLFPWILSGWLIFVFATRIPGRLYEPLLDHDEVIK